MSRVLANFQGKYAAREKALHHGREVVRHSANAIRAIHRGDLDAARLLLKQAQALLLDTEAALAGHGDIYHAGFVHDAQKEYAEACVTLALVAREPLPEPEALGVGYAAYLNGAGEAIGELRRQVLDRIRQGEAQVCEELLAAMEEIYGVLVMVDFPDAMTGGLRRTTDAARGILERTRGDLTMALTQRALVERLDGLQRRLS
ncbi:MAG: haloacid dehalogenase [Chloroflexi bacterium]|nr:haloacid dehalogenase [Chloroflexota bacterium]